MARMDEQTLHPPLEPREIAWCDKHYEPLMECGCADEDPDAAYEHMRDRMLEMDDRDE